ncbi:hypothetical protein [Dissulfurimicrobium hydrothermale]|uniref:hypothetical protein n=1 Tax=Dissulfurimicrobium hydrothermale TaxID=1750598 RepID=UPI001ED9CB97|nr:hypothetical protein [Dissulfurimicrobium hydrothermale]UKL13573.1 hypothetical protein LGS26_08910 [Dissulfurimicrobium hydrothermale]
MKKQLKKKFVVTTLTVVLLIVGVLLIADNTKSINDRPLGISAKDVQQFDMYNGQYQYFVKWLQDLDFSGSRQLRINALAQTRDQDNSPFWKRLADDDELERIEDELDKIRKEKRYTTATTTC